MAAKTTQERLQEHIAAQRRRSREATAKLTEADKAQILAEATIAARQNGPVTTPVPLGEKVPVAARLATAEEPAGVILPKLQKADIQRFKSRHLEVVPWLRHVDEAIAKHRQKGDVLSTTLRRVAELIGWSSRATEYVQKTFVQIAAQLGAGAQRETVRKAIRWLEDHDVIDSFNTLHRDGRKLERGANLYLPVPASMSVAPADVPAADAPAELAPLVRAQRTLKRWAGRFGLMARNLGLNVTAAASKLRTDPERRTPAKAAPDNKPWRPERDPQPA